MDDVTFMGQSHQMQKIKAYIAKVSLTDTTVLITGETGTGKEVVAEQIYRSSKRSEKPFVCLNCAAIPDSLLESELFGYERGAFTGALTMQKGKFELAHGGTLFLDEIGDMNHAAQAKLLRVLENREIQRLGGKQSTSLDIRIIAATNQSLEHLVSQETFRKDLFYRLSVARIHVPPLRDRKEDIDSLLKHYIQTFNARFGSEVTGATDEVIECLINYDWPGNVRELRNVIEGMFIDLSSSSTITVLELPDYIRAHTKMRFNGTTERDRLLAALFATKWNKTKAAEQLKWSRMTLYRKIARYHISGPEAASFSP